MNPCESADSPTVTLCRSIDPPPLPRRRLPPSLARQLASGAVGGKVLRANHPPTAALPSPGPPPSGQRSGRRRATVMTSPRKRRLHAHIALPDGTSTSPNAARLAQARFSPSARTECARLITHGCVHACVPARCGAPRLRQVAIKRSPMRREPHLPPVGCRAAAAAAKQQPAAKSPYPGTTWPVESIRCAIIYPST